MLSNSALEKTLKKFGKWTTLLGYGGSVLTIVCIGYGFYSGTNKTLEDHGEAIKEVKTDVVEIKKKINASDVFQGVSTADYNALKDKVAGIEKTVDKIDSKLDRVLIQTK